MASGAADVFLSYKAEDRARLVPLAQALEAEGFSVWWDVHIEGGTNWHEDIVEHLESAKCVVVAWSKRSVGPAGQFVRDEARRAQRRNVYVPIRLDPIEPPLGFGEIQALSLKGWKGDRFDPRFQALASAVRSHISGKPALHRHAYQEHRDVSRRALLAAGAGVAVLAAAGGWYVLNSGQENAKRIAVLPFANLSGTDDQAYFAEGIAEELRSALSRIGLQVIGRASSAAVKDLDTKIAAAKLGVGNILTGSVRRSPGAVRVNAQLVGGSDGVQHWAQTYDMAAADEIKIQADIAANVAQALSIALNEGGKSALTLGGTTDAGALDLFLRASDLYSNDTSDSALRQAIALLDSAIQRDGNYANAYRLKARALELLGTSSPKSASEMANTVAEAAAAARKAIAIAPKLGPAYAELALIEQDQYNYAKAFKYIERALTLSPDDPLVLPSAMYIKRYLGDPRDALSLADRLVQLDPLNAITYTRRASVLIALRRYPEAIDAARKSLELAPQRTSPHQLIGDCLVLMNRLNDARDEYQKVPADDVFRLAGEAIIAGLSRDLAAVNRIIAQMRELFGDAASYNYAQVYAQAGEKDRAFSALSTAFNVRDAGLTGLKTDPFLDPIRSDPRFAALIRKLRFP